MYSRFVERAELAGVIGVSISYHLAQRGVKTTVIDRAGIASCVALLFIAVLLVWVDFVPIANWDVLIVCVSKTGWNSIQTGRHSQNQALARQVERLVDFWREIGILDHQRMSFLKRVLICMRSLEIA